MLVYDEPCQTMENGVHSLEAPKQHTLPKPHAITVIVAILALLCIAFASYAGGYYAAGETVAAACQSTDEVAVSDEDSIIVFGDPDTAKAGVIIYPGAKVDGRAYAPLAQRIAAQGYYVVLSDPPFNLAWFDPDVAQKVIVDTPQVERWYVAGHSMGGAVMSLWASANYSEASGFIFLASYPIADLSETGVPTLSIYGSRDKVLNLGNYQSARYRLPANSSETVITGGNHAGFGDYGIQNGDGTANITQEYQWDETASTIVEFMEATE